MNINDRLVLANRFSKNLVDKDVDPNELARMIEYLSNHDGERLMVLLERILRTRSMVVRSSKTLRYYQDIQNTFREVSKKAVDADELLYIMGWTARLMRYYKTKLGSQKKSGKRQKERK